MKTLSLRMQHSCPNKTFYLSIYSYLLPRTQTSRVRAVGSTEAAEAMASALFSSANIN